MFVLSASFHVWWLLVPIVPLHWFMRNYRKKHCICPFCQQTLIGFDGDSVFAKSCEHCGAVFKRDQV